MSATSCAPLCECRVVHFLRHAEAESNAAAHKFPRDSPEYNTAYADSKFVDSVLTAKGEAQCKASRAAQAASRLHYDVVVSSPLRRTLQTASLVFQEHEVPWLAVESAREYSHGHARPCDTRRPREAQQADFANVDFARVLASEDVFAVRAESQDDLDKRIDEFLSFLRDLPQSFIAVAYSIWFTKRPALRWRTLASPHVFLSTTSLGRALRPFQLRVTLRGRALRPHGRRGRGTRPSRLSMPLFLES